MTTPNQRNKEKKLNSQKALLNKRINELGIDGILYPSITLDRHPYTQEVIIMAMSQDIKQEELTKICNVSQSQVSQWANGHGFAKIKQLEKLVPRLKNTAPGDEFTQLKVVRKTTIELPDNWEEECFFVYFKNKLKQSMTSELLALIESKVLEKEKTENRDTYHFRYHNYEANFDTKIDLSLLELSVYGQLKQEHVDLLNREEELHHDQINSLNEQISTLNEFKTLAEKEAQNNLKLESDHITVINAFYDERPELNEVKEEVKTTLALREYPKPKISYDAKHKFSAKLAQLSTKYGITKIDEIKICQSIESEIQKNKGLYSNKITDIKSQQENEIIRKTIFNKYKPDSFKSIDINQSLVLPVSEIKEQSNQIYNEDIIKLVTPIKTVIRALHSHERFHEITNIDITINPKQAFIDYCNKLPVSYEHELVQISGEKIFSSESDENNSLDCYRLHSNKLMLKHKLNSQTYIYVENNADDAIKKAQLLDELHKITLEDNLKFTLIEQGYLLNNVRTIY